MQHNSYGGMAVQRVDPMSCQIQGPELCSLLSLKFCVEFLCKFSFVQVGFFRVL